MNGERKEPSDPEKQLAWMAEDTKAKVIIFHALSQDILGKMISLPTSKTIWDTLKTKFYIRIDDNEADEDIRELMINHFDNCGSVEEYITKISTAIRKIERNLPEGQAWPEYLDVRFLLCNLGPTWREFMTIYMNCMYDSVKITLVDVSDALIDQERRANAYSGSVAGGASSKKGSGGGNGNTNRVPWKIRRRWTCKHCRRVGHKEPGCWVLHPEKKPGGPRGGIKGP